MAMVQRGLVLGNLRTCVGGVPRVGHVNMHQVSY